MAQKRWLPNRMFDPASNPFAIQNLMEKQAPPFNPMHDERPQSGFGVDAVLGGSVVRAFEVDQRLLMSEETAQAEGTGFVPEAAAPAAGFDAPVRQAAGFSPDDTGMQAPADTADPGDAPAAGVDAAVGAAPEAPVEAAPAVAAMESVDPSPQAMHEDGSAPAGTEPAMTSEAMERQLEAVRAEAYEQGLQAGIAQGREAERPNAHRDGYDEGFLAGLAQARSEFEAEREQERQQALQQQHDAQQAKLDQLQSVIDGLQQLSTDPDALFEPMKRLAVHLAEQLVRGELTQAPQAISRLVDNALRELNATGDKPVVVHLHPEDLELYRPTVAQFSDSLILRPDNLLERGSVRASLDGSVVEDMLQRRLAGLKQSLSQPAAPGWRSAGGKLSERLAEGERGSRQVEDVTPVEQVERAAEAAPAEGDA